jgi:hypothetical protein
MNYAQNMIDANNTMNTVLTKAIERLTPEFLSTLKVKTDLTFDKRSTAKIRELFADLEIKTPEFSTQWISLQPAKWQTILEGQKLINVDLMVKYYWRASECGTNYGNLTASFDCKELKWFNHNKPLPSLAAIQEKQKEHKLLKQQEKALQDQIRLIEREFSINKYSEIEK